MFFFFNDTATTEIYTLSLHDALPISAFAARRTAECEVNPSRFGSTPRTTSECGDRKSTRLNSSHGYISYAVFCLKKKNMTSTRANILRAEPHIFPCYNYTNAADTDAT